MEVVLLWLDDLDDLLFSAALGWERLRRVVLQIGLAARSRWRLRAVDDRDAVVRRRSPASPPRASAPGSWAPRCGPFYYRRAERLTDRGLKKPS